jgi:hypothetical protein
MSVQLMSVLAGALSVGGLSFIALAWQQEVTRHVRLNGWVFKAKLDKQSRIVLTGRR